MVNYEQKYKEALERAQRLSIDGFLDAVAISDIFPELNESEDENRNWILEYLYDGLRKADEQFKPQFESVIAWLEKQGEKLDADDVIEWLENHFLMTPNGGYYYLPKDCIKQFKKDFGL